jgi:transposase InsO family protein
MNAHQNARTTPYSRAAMISRVLEQGQSAKEVATSFAISERTVRKWLGRYRAGGLAAIENAASTPHRVANKLPQPWIDLMARLRREYRMTGAEIAARLRLPRSTVAGHLARLGLGQLEALEPKPPARRYARQRPGELLHLDTKNRARFERVGHRITGDRLNASDGAGWEFVHVAVDDASRLAYVEVLPDERRHTVTGFLVRALRWLRQRGVRVERVMTDNGSGYVSRLFRNVCRWLGIRHIRTRPYTPKTNGKAERFIQTLMREWAYALPYRSSDTRAADLPRWTAWYNQHRPHASLGGNTPISRLLPQP